MWPKIPSHNGIEIDPWKKPLSQPQENLILNKVPLNKILAEGNGNNLISSHHLEHLEFTLAYINLPLAPHTEEEQPTSMTANTFTPIHWVTHIWKYFKTTNHISVPKNYSEVLYILHYTKPEF